MAGSPATAVKNFTPLLGLPTFPHCSRCGDVGRDHIKSVRNTGRCNVPLTKRGRGRKAVKK